MWQHNGISLTANSWTECNGADNQQQTAAAATDTRRWIMWQTCNYHKGQTNTLAGHVNLHGTAQCTVCGDMEGGSCNSNNNIQPPTCISTLYDTSPISLPLHQHALLPNNCFLKCLSQTIISLCYNGCGQVLSKMLRPNLTCCRSLGLREMLRANLGLRISLSKMLRPKLGLKTKVSRTEHSSAGNFQR